MRGSMMRRPLYRPFGGCPPPFSPPPPLPMSRLPIPSLRCPPVFMSLPFRRTRLPPSQQPFFAPPPISSRPPFPPRPRFPREMILRPRRTPKTQFRPYPPSEIGSRNVRKQPLVEKVEGLQEKSCSNGHSEPDKTVMNSNDAQTTPELKIPADMMQPLFCKLCDAKLNGALQASAHYEGKNHLKKERQYLEQLRLQKGITSPLPMSNGKSEKKQLEEEYCKICDVAFTSEIQAKQHYNGRNHQRRLRGEPPLPKGFFNPHTGKWQRQPPSGGGHKLSQQATLHLSNVCVSSQVTTPPQIFASNNSADVIIPDRLLVVEGSF